MRSTAAFALLALWLPGAPAQEDPPSEDKAIVAAVEAAAKALNERKGRAFADCFNTRRLVDEIRSQGGLDPAEGGGKAQVLEASVRLGLITMVSQIEKLETDWGTVLNPRVRVLKPGAEAVVSCILKDSDGEKDRYRFWTIRDKAAWKIYDFESVNDGVRLSILLTSILNDAEGDPRKLAALARAAAVFQGITAQLAAGETEKVLEALQTLDLENLPKTLAAIFEMIEGAVLIAEGQEEKGLAVLDRCLTHRPDLPRALRLKSEVCLSLRRFDDVVRAEQEYLKIIVDDPDAFFNIGNAFRELRKVDEAIEAHRKGADCDPEDAPNRLRLGILLAGRGRPEEAKKHLLDAFNRSDDASEAYAEAAGEIMKTDAMELLRDLAAGQAKEREEEAQPLYHQGHALRRLGSHEEARKILARARELDKDEDFASELLEELACTLAHLGKEHEAGNLSDELEESDENAATYVRAYVHAAAGRDGDALPLLKKVFKQVPALHEKVAREAVFRRLREGGEGRTLLAAAKAKAEYDDAHLPLIIGDKHEKIRELAEARVKAAPGDTDAWHHLGGALRKLGRHGEAEKALRAGLEKEEAEENRPRFWDELGQALARGGKPKEALEWAARLQGNEAWIEEGLYVAAAAHALAGDRKASLDSLRKLFEKDPDHIGQIEADAAFQELRKDPDYAALVRRARARSDE